MHDPRLRERPFRPKTVRKHRGGGGEAPKIDTRTAEWDKFYRSQSAYLRKMAVAMRLAPDQTEDVIQDVWLATLKNLHQFIGENALRRVRVWMRGVMRRKTANAFRRRRFVSLDDLATEPMASTGTEIEVERRAWLARGWTKWRRTNRRTLSCFAATVATGERLRIWRQRTL
jgi:DNA-directed RNA polymerase specialized sigma24 family protein